MTVLIPTTIADVRAALDQHPDAKFLAGGTDSMIEINSGRARPTETVIVLNRVAELRSWRFDPGRATVRIGAAVTWTELMTEPLRTRLPALAEAARTVGSPQIRNAGTLGGNLATCSPAGDGLPVLVALDAQIELSSPGGHRTLPVPDFMVGVKRTALEPGEIIEAITVPVINGWQGYAKVGVRNAMVIAVASTCVVIDRDRESVAIALGSVSPTILRADAAEEHATAAINWKSMSISADALGELARLVTDAARPITDHRSTAEYRRHAVGVLTRRLTARALTTEVAA